MINLISFSPRMGLSDGHYSLDEWGYDINHFLKIQMLLFNFIQRCFTALKGAT